MDPASELPDDDDSEKASWSLTGIIAHNGMIQTLAIMLLVSVVGWAVPKTPLQTPILALEPPILDPWWAIFTAGYSHLSPAHFAANATMVIVFGGLISISTTAPRFHAFFITTGVLTSVTQVAAAAAFETPIAVLGSSGSAFALMGYVLVANPVGDGIFSILGRRDVLIVMLLLGGALTIYFSAAGSALMSHFVGAVLGIASGRIHLLSTDKR